MGFIIGTTLAILVIILIISNIKIVPQSMCYVIERLGVYNGTWETGLHFKLPIFDRIAKKISLKEQVVDFKPQPVITKDNVTMQIDTVVFYQVTDAKLYAYGVEPVSYTHLDVYKRQLSLLRYLEVWRHCQGPADSLSCS